MLKFIACLTFLIFSRCLFAEETVASSQNGNKIYRSENGEEFSSEIFFQSPGNIPICMTSTKIKLAEAQVHDNGIGAGIFKKEKDKYKYVERVFIFDSNRDKFIELSAPCPTDWEIEDARILGIKENGEVFYYLFLDRYKRKFEKFKNAFAHKFANESIHCSYNIHTKVFTYFLKNLETEEPEIYISKDNKKFKKLNDETKEKMFKTFLPLFAPDLYSINTVCDNEITGTTHFDHLSFTWNTKTGFTLSKNIEEEECDSGLLYQPLVENSPF
jgi:hypothetical protein